MYIEMGPEGYFIYGGVYMPEKAEIDMIRREIMYNPEAFNAIVEDDDFKEMFGSVQGDRNKKIDAAYAEAIKVQPLILNKQWYHFVKLDPQTISRPELMEITLKHFQTALPLQIFLIDALNN